MVYKFIFRYYDRKKTRLVRRNIDKFQLNIEKFQNGIKYFCDDIGLEI